MKKGDKVYTKITNDIAYVVGFYENLVWIGFYRDDNLLSNSYQIKKVNNKLPYCSPYFSDTFITEKEIRKLKLEKLYEKNL